MGAREVVWLQKLLAILFYEHLKLTMIHCDNQSCIKLSMNLVFDDRSKHIEIPYQYVRDMLKRRFIHLEYINTSDQTNDILNKPLQNVKVDHFKKKLGMVEMRVYEIESHHCKFCININKDV